jgi:hypothetical protein
MTDDFENDSDDDDGLGDPEDEDQDTDDAASGDGDSESKEQSKRIRDLQSKADKAEARANKAEKALKDSKAKANPARVDGKDGEEVPAAVREWLVAAEDRLRESLYEEDPRFKEFSIDPALISGATPAAMRESKKALVAFVDKLETGVRDKVLVEHGFRPEPKTSERQEPVNYATMTAEEFAKHEKRALEGGMLRRSG